MSAARGPVGPCAAACSRMQRGPPYHRAGASDEGEQFVGAISVSVSKRAGIWSATANSRLPAWNGSLRGRFQPSFEDVVAGQHERHPPPAAWSCPPQTSEPGCADMSGRDFGHTCPRCRDRYLLPVEESRGDASSGRSYERAERGAVNGRQSALSALSRRHRSCSARPTDWSRRWPTSPCAVRSAARRAGAAVDDAPAWGVMC